MVAVPSWAIAIDQNDRLVFQYISVEALTYFEVRVRQITLDGHIITSKYQYAVASNDTIYEEVIVLAPGYIVSIDIITDDGVGVYGSAFGRITLNRLEAGEAGPILERASGDIFDRASVSWALR